MLNEIKKELPVEDVLISYEDCSLVGGYKVFLVDVPLLEFVRLRLKPEDQDLAVHWHNLE